MRSPFDPAYPVTGLALRSLTIELRKQNVIGHAALRGLKWIAHRCASTAHLRPLSRLLVTYGSRGLIMLDILAMVCAFVLQIWIEFYRRCANGDIRITTKRAAHRGLNRYHHHLDYLPQPSSVNLSASCRSRPFGQYFGRSTLDVVLKVAPQ